MVKIPAFIGWILIVVGVWGEFFTDGLVSDADASIQSFISITLSQSEKETAFALERAAHAEATARRFEAQIAESAARVKTAEARIASADSASRQAVATVSSAEARIAEAQRAAAESKKRLRA